MEGLTQDSERSHDDDPGLDHPVESAERRWDRLRSWRDRVKSRRTSRIVYRIAVGVIGGAITVGGLLLVPLPGPGWAIVILGLVILASEFTWAQRLRDFVTHQVRAWTRWLGRQSIPVRVAVGVATAAFVAGVL